MTESCRPKRDQSCRKQRWAARTWGYNKDGSGKGLFGVSTWKELIKKQGFTEKKKGIHSLHSSQQESTRALKKLITTMPAHQSRRCTGKSCPANKNYFPKWAHKYISHLILMRRISLFFFFFADIGHCGLWSVCLGLDYQLTTSNPFYLSFLPLALRNENQDSQPRCVTSTSS